MFDSNELFRFVEANVTLHTFSSLHRSSSRTDNINQQSIETQNLKTEITFSRFQNEKSQFLKANLCDQLGTLKPTVD